MNTENNMQAPLNVNKKLLTTSTTVNSNRHNKKVFPFKINCNLSKWQMIRLGFILLLLVGIALNTFLGFALPSNEIDCLDDYLFKITAGANEYFGTHPRGRSALLIISSLAIDIMVFISFFHWALYSISWRLILALISFYSFRAIIQAMFAMKFPDGYLWIDPGFPSLFVSYLKTRDFFFSGHVGFPIILAQEWNRIKKYYLQIVCYLVCFLELLTMVFLRGHYSIDLISGLVFSHYFFIIMEPLAIIVDKWRYMDMKEKNRPPQVEPISNVNNICLNQQDEFQKV